jgi:hypothetical protein
MDDFNDDNEKIDAALTAQASRGIQQLQKITVEETCTSITVDLSNIDWSQWLELRIDVSLTTENSSDMTLGINNGGKSEYATSTDSNYTTGSLGKLWNANKRIHGDIRLFVGCNAENPILCTSTSYRVACFGHNAFCTFGDVTKLSMSGPTITAGTVTVWGIHV